MPSERHFPTPLHERVHQRLQRIGEGPAAFFADACTLMGEPKRLDTTSHLVGHLMREVESGVRAVLLTNVVDPPTPVAPPPSDRGPRASKKTKSAGGGDTHMLSVRAILAALGFSDDHAVAVRWMAMAGREAPKGLHRLAHRDALRAPRPVDRAFEDDWATFVPFLDEILERFDTRYAAVYVRLDALLTREPPTEADVKVLKEQLPNTPMTLGYFFERLAHSSWLQPLREAGFFATPRAEFSVAADKVSFPPWPQAEYLRRIAPECPEAVCEVIEAVASTDNARAQGQLIAVAVSLPRDARVRVAPVVERWLPSLARFYWGDEAVQFVVSLASDGEADIALRLTEQLIGLPAEELQHSRRPSLSTLGAAGHRAVAVQLRNAASTLAPALFEAAGLRALEVFASALDQIAGRVPDAAGAAPTIETSAAGVPDKSEFWLDSFDDEDRAHPSDLRVLLAYVVRDGVIALGSSAAASLTDACAVLRQFGARVLRRIELDAVRLMVEREGNGPALAIAETLLTTESLAVTADLTGEYVRLLQVAIPMLGPEAKEQVLGVATTPPDFAWMQDAEYQRARRAHWTRDRLASVAEHLPLAWRERLTILTREEGEPQPLGRRRPHIASWVGPTSPKSDEELIAMSPEALAAYLKTWQPVREWAAPSPEGLARQLSKLVTADPVRYASHATEFIGLAPTYVRALLQGLEAASRAETSFPWDAVLALAEWTVEQEVPPTDMGGGEEWHEDADWRRARRVVADLIGLGLSDGPGPIALSERDRVWRILLMLSEDENPSPAYDLAHEGALGPAMVALDSVRPQALDAIFRYAFWASGGARTSGVASPGERGFSGIPEVADLIDRRLDPHVDSSPAIRVVFGRWLVDLAELDPRWFAEKVARLLPEEEAEGTLREAAWGAFLRGGPPRERSLGLFVPLYRKALMLPASDEGTDDAPEERIDDRLAAHVMQLYWWGLIGIDTPDGLIADLFQRGDARRRPRAIAFTGFSLLNSPGPVPSEPLDRLCTLWDWRAQILISESAAGRGPSDAAQKEFREFGWWFASRTFNPNWSLPRVEQAARIAHVLEVEHAVLEHLAETSADHPGPAVAALNAFALEGRGDPWRVLGSLDEIRMVLVNASRGDADAQRAAKAVANRLVAIGQTQFRDLA